MKKVTKLIGLLIAVMMVAGAFACAAPAATEVPAAPAIQDAPKAEAPKAEEAAPAEEAPVEEAATGIGPDMLLLPTMENMGDKFPGSWDNYGLVGRMMIFSRLLRLNDKLEPVYGDLASEWTQTPDGLHYEFTLKEGVKWHDGEDFSAEDVVCSIQAALLCGQVNNIMKTAFSKIKGAAEYQAAGELYADIEGLKAEGNKVIIDMVEPCGTFLLSCAQFNIFPKHIIGAYDAETVAAINTSAFYDWPIGTGPYKVTEFVPNDYALFEYFPDYFGWDAEPEIKTIKMQQMTQADYAVNALADNIDYFAVNDLGTALAAIENPNYEAFYTDIYFIRYFFWNSHCPNDPLSDINVRRAIVKAIDREALCASLMPNQAAVTNTKVPMSFDYYNDDPEIAERLSYDPEAAKAMLEAANFDFNSEIKLICYYSDQGTANFMDAICEYLKAVGVNASWKLITGDITGQLYAENADFNLAYAGLSAMAVEEAYNLYKNATLNSGVNARVFPNDYTGLDALIDELAVCVDAARRTEILKEIQKIESDETLWFLPMFSLRNIQVFNTARVNLPAELVLSNEWSNYERYLEKWSINAAE